MEQECITPTGAWLTATTISAAYVASLYVLPKRIRQLPRDHPRHIYGRFAAVALSSVFAIALYARVADPRCLGVDGVAAALGLRLDGSARAALKGAACVAILYLGTLAERFVLGAFALPEINPQSGRNLVVGPVTEELCFRACVVPLLVEAGITRWRAVRAAPLVFGLAHVHHGRRRVVDDGVPLSHAVIETTVQFAYTSLFGAFASYSFCRTHRLSAPVAAHVLCNYLGLPAFACLRPGSVLYDYRLAFVALHIAGIALFFTRSGWLLSSSESVLWA